MRKIASGLLGIVLSMASVACEPQPKDSNSPSTQPYERLPIAQVEKPSTISREFIVKGESYVQMTASTNMYYFTSETESSIKTFEVVGDSDSGKADALINPGDRVKISFPQGTDLEKNYKFRISYWDIQEINGKRTH